MSISLDANLRLSQEMAASAKTEGVLGRASTPAANGARDDKAEIKKIAEDFESLFLDLVLKSMRQTVQKGGMLDGGNAEEIYRSMLDNEYSKMMAAQRSTGLADSIEKFLLDAYGDGPAKPMPAQVSSLGSPEGAKVGEKAKPQAVDELIDRVMEGVGKARAVKAYKAQELPVTEKRETMGQGLSPASHPRPKAI